MSSPNRRELLGAAAALAACACAACPLASLSAAAAAEAASGTVDAGPVRGFGREGVYADRAEPAAGGFLVVRRGGRLYAVTSTCSHKRFTLAVKDGQIVCPKHGSRFTADGVPTKAPARKPLVRFGVSVNADGRLIVDRSHRFEKGDWDRPGSFIAVGRE
jgi:nitrite reductase/ring-hydroxylating ferredoxin subunit